MPVLTDADETNNENCYTFGCQHCVCVRPPTTTPQGTGARARQFYKWLGTEAPRVDKQETDRTVLIIAKALTKTTNYICRAKKWRDTTKMSGALRTVCVPRNSASGLYACSCMTIIEYCWFLHHVIVCTRTARYFVMHVRGVAR